jgi:late competence protein required for DNA uptake (superfamily II DNA/RNA helicase)
MHQYNIRSVTCNSCSDTAIEYDNDSVSASTLDGKVCVCQSCSVLGRIDAEEYVRFYPLSSEDLSYVDFGLIVEAYEASQKRIDELYSEISSLRMKLSQQGVMA